MLDPDPHITNKDPQICLIFVIAFNQILIKSHGDYISQRTTNLNKLLWRREIRCQAIAEKLQVVFTSICALHFRIRSSWDANSNQKLSEKHLLKLQQKRKQKIADSWQPQTSSMKTISIMEALIIKTISIMEGLSFPVSSVSAPARHAYSVLSSVTF
jgi:hypothetical protein